MEHLMKQYHTRTWTLYSPFLFLRLICYYHSMSSTIGVCSETKILFAPKKSLFGNKPISTDGPNLSYLVFSLEI